MQHSWRKGGKGKYELHAGFWGELYVRKKTIKHWEQNSLILKLNYVHPLLESKRRNLRTAFDSYRINHKPFSQEKQAKIPGL